MTIFNQVHLSPFAEKAILLRLVKNAQKEGARGAFHPPVRQAILSTEAYLDLPCNGKG